MKNYIFQFINEREWNLPGLKSLKENTYSSGENSDSDTDHYNFKNKVAIVTGASSGIGKAIAMDLAVRGAIVIMASRNEKKLNALTKEIQSSGGHAIPYITDVTREEDCRLLIEGTVKTYGRIDILINNAGISMRANFNEVRLEVLKKVMDTNFWGSVYCTRYALPHIIEQKGSIVGISSICGITPLPGRTGYSASKHAMDGFFESLRLENIDKELHVMLVHPGFTTSNIRNVAYNKDGNPQVETPLDEEKLMSAENVATEVARGIEQKKRDIILSREGKLITWIYRQMPSLAERLIYREMKKEVGAPF
jgi:short-subunit dehydrogenase